ncbi:hypothetical protein AWC38_SpisGene20967, partial [Stylophora pistillata]
MDELETYTKAALLAKGKEMGLKGLHGLNKKDLIEVIKNPHTRKKDSKAELLMKAKELGLQGLYKLKKKDLIEVIKNPPPPSTRYCGVRKMERGLHGYSRLRKDELIRLIQSRPSTSSSSSNASTASTSKKGDSKRAKREKRETREAWSGIGKEEWEKWLNDQTEKKFEKVATFNKKRASKRAGEPLLDLPIPQQRQNNADSPPRSGNLLDDLVPEHGQKILKPTKPQGVKKKIEKAVDWGKKKVEDWGQWLKGVANTPQAVDDKLKDFKQYINELYKKSNNVSSFKLVERESSLKRFIKTYTIDGVGGYGPKDFLEVVKPIVINFLNTQKNIKIEFVFRCEMIKKNIITGEDEMTTSYFSSSQKIVFDESDREELYQESVEKMMESMATFLRNGSGWAFNRVEGLDLRIVKYTPLKGSSYIKLPKHLAKKMAIINMQNEDEECFKWCVTRALYPVRSHPERITKILRNQASHLVWDDIKFPME